MKQLRPQILLDIEEAEMEFVCEIERVTAEMMIREVAQAYRPGINFEALLDSVVAKEQCLTDGQWHAYKYVLGKEFQRRRQSRTKVIIDKDRDA